MTSGAPNRIPKPKFGSSAEADDQAQKASLQRKTCPHCAGEFQLLDPICGNASVTQVQLLSREHPWRAFC